MGGLFVAAIKEVFEDFVISLMDAYTGPDKSGVSDACTR